MSGYNSKSKKLGSYSYDIEGPKWQGNEERDLTRLVGKKRARYIMLGAKNFFIEKRRFKHLGSMEDTQERRKDIRKLKETLEQVSAILSDESFSTYMFNRTRELLGNEEAESLLSVQGGCHSEWKFLLDTKLLLRTCYIIDTPDKPKAKRGTKKGSKNKPAITPFLFDLIVICEETQGGPLKRTKPWPKDSLLYKVWDVIEEPIGEENFPTDGVFKILETREAIIFIMVILFFPPQKTLNT